MIYTFFSLFPDLCQYKNDNNLICVNIQKTQKIKIKIVKLLKQNKKDLYAYLCVCVWDIDYSDCDFYLFVSVTIDYFGIST